MPTFDDVLGAAESLPSAERVRLIDALIESVPMDEWPAPSEQWIAEVQRRSAELAHASRYHSVLRLAQRGVAEQSPQKSDLAGVEQFVRGTEEQRAQLGRKHRVRCVDRFVECVIG